MPSTPLPLAFLPDIGSGEVMVVVLVVLLLFGGDKMPQLARGLAKALREFKKAAGNVEQEFKRALDEVPEVPPAKPAPPAERPLPPPASPAEPPFPRFPPPKP